MDLNIQQFKEKLKVLTGMLDNLKAPSEKVKQLKQSVYVLRKLLEHEDNIVSPYGPTTTIVPYSLN